MKSESRICYELTLTSSYVSNWTFCDAIRELIQNGIDQETIDPTNEFTLEYDEMNQSLKFINTKSKLNINTLLLGKTSKSNNDATVGQFGEGYKIAALVLNRLGKTFTIYNNMKKEVWESRFKNSEKWKEKILAFYVSKIDTTNTGLVIEVGNVNSDEYYEIADVWINFDNNYDYIKKAHTKYGDILMDESYQGLVFVNGLSIDYSGELHYGYNFKPQYVRLERDRKTCDSWNAKIITSKMIAEAMISGEVEPEVVRKLVEQDTDDIYQMDIITENGNVKKLLIEEFDKEHTKPFSVPVGNDEQFRRVKALGGYPVIVPYRVAKVLASETDERIEELVNMPMSSGLTLAQKFERWISIYADLLSDNAVNELRELVNELE